MTSLKVYLKQIKRLQLPVHTWKSPHPFVKALVCFAFLQKMQNILSVDCSYCSHLLNSAWLSQSLLNFLIFFFFFVCGSQSILNCSEIVDKSSAQHVLHLEEAISLAIVCDTAHARPYLQAILLGKLAHAHSRPQICKQIWRSNNSVRILLASSI